MGDSDDPDPVSVTANNKHSMVHEIDVTITGPDGATFLEESTTLEAESNGTLGSFTPRNSDTQETYAADATIDDEIDKSIEFPTGGASGTWGVHVFIDLEGDVEVSRSRV